MTFKHFIQYKIPFVWKWNKRHNPYYEWWKVRKYFKPPKPHILIGKKIWFYGLPIADCYYNKWITCKWQGLGWKPKYDEVRHEWNPMFWICWRKKWFFIVMFTYGNDSISNMGTWECLLSMLYNNTAFSDAVRNYEWPQCPIVSNLTKYGLKKYYEERQNSTDSN